MHIDVTERQRRVNRRKHTWDEDKFVPFDWKLEHSYTNVSLFFILGARGYGKTFGLRLENIENYWRNRRRFVEIVRYKNELPDLERNYFAKIESQREFPDLMFRVENDIAYVAERSDEPDWECAGYFLALSDEQNIKKRSSGFDRVRDFVLDEAVIDRSKNKRIHYHAGEYSLIMGIMNSVLREVPGQRADARLHLLGNACDLTCPLFEAVGVKSVPKMGRTYYGSKKQAMVHRLEPRFSESFRDETTVGQLMSLSAGSGDDAGVFFDNAFLGEYCDSVARKPKGARHVFTISFGMLFGIWYDFDGGLVYVTRKAPNDGTKTIALLRRDATIDYSLLKKSSDLVDKLARFERARLFRFEDAALASRFGEFLGYIGVR